MSALHAQVRDILHADVASSSPLAGGCISDVRHLSLKDGRNIVAKIGTGAVPGLALEGFMLEYLARSSQLPVPRVLFADDHLLLMDYLPVGGSIDASAETDAAEHIAALHSVTSADFGFSCDTLIGGLAQPNPKHGSWRAFFRDQRLMHMGREALLANRLPQEALNRLERFCSHLDKWIGEPDTASLLHGDLWTGNVLVSHGTISGFIDPAIYFGDPEIELAFSTLFGTFGDAFFKRYSELRGIAPGFFEERRDIYNLYPLLVHVRLFGGSYVSSVDRTLRRFGY